MMEGTYMPFSIFSSRGAGSREVRQILWYLVPGGHHVHTVSIYIQLKRKLKCAGTGSSLFLLGFCGHVIGWLKEDR